MSEGSREYFVSFHRVRERGLYYYVMNGTQFLHGCYILLVNFRDGSEELKAKRRLIEKFGGVVMESLTSATTHVLVNTTGTLKTLNDAAKWLQEKRVPVEKRFDAQGKPIKLTAKFHYASWLEHAIRERRNPGPDVLILPKQQPSIAPPTTSHSISLLQQQQQQEELEPPPPQQQQIPPSSSSMLQPPTTPISIPIPTATTHFPSNYSRANDWLYKRWKLEYSEPDKISDRFRCRICFDVALDPMFAGTDPKCVCIYCRACIESCFADDPRDRACYNKVDCAYILSASRVRSIVGDKFLVRFLGALKCFCPLRHLGCQWVGARSDIVQHCAKCEWKNKMTAQEDEQPQPEDSGTLTDEELQDLNPNKRPKKINNDEQQASSSESSTLRDDELN